ncbi:MAG TPA: ester cyclase [Actinomycetota bacterium]|jgi:steroid delta-isomerase-like uncharacterized protein
MPIETNKQVVQRFYGEVLNEHKVDLLEELAVPDYDEHDMLPGQGTGLGGLRDRVTMLINGINPRFAIQDVIAEGDKVVVRWKNSGVHTGEFLGIPATGKPYGIDGIDIYRLQDGKMAEHWHVIDNLAMLQQLGLIPSPESAG